MACALDNTELTPSDFSLVVRNIPLDITKEKLISLIEERFSRSKVKVVYVNYCYNIEDIVKLNSQITELVKKKGFYRLHLKKEMAIKSLKKNDIIQNPSLIDPPIYREMLIFKKKLSLKEIEEEIKLNQMKI